MRPTTIQRRRSLRTLGVAAATPLLLVSLAACGGSSDTADDSSSDTTTSTTSAAPGGDDTATAEPSESESADTSDTDAADGEEIDKAAFVDQVKSGVEDMTTAHISMTMDGAAAMTTEGDIDYQTTPPSMSMTMEAAQMGGSGMEIRLVDGIFYMNMGQMSQNKFFKIDSDDPNSPLGDMDGLTASMDPSKSFEQFEEGITKVTLVGDDEIEGESVKQYRMTLDTTKIKSMQGAETSGMPKTLEYDVWLDSDNRMRQVAMDLGKQVGSMKMTVTKMGEPVDIVAPPKNQITTMPGQ